MVSWPCRMTREVRMFLGALGWVAATAAAPLSMPQVIGGTQGPAVRTASAEVSVLTYNIRGLPWPFATGRATALKKIGRELAVLRAEGRQPDIVLIQEGFRGEVADLVKASGYRYWVQGPTRWERPRGAAPADGQDFKATRYP